MMRIAGTTLRMASSRHRCAYCGRHMVQQGRGPERASWDHVRPREWGGDDSADNFRRVCQSCNELRAMCGHCIGALACVRSVAQGHPLFLIRRWFPRTGDGRWPGPERRSDV